MPSSNRTIAFALGGLAGSNAHGVGFLAAAHACRVKPDFISCTSGMIYWVWRYLTHPDSLASDFKNAARQAAPYPFRLQNLWHLATVGMPGVFAPAWWEWWARMLRPPSGIASLDKLTDEIIARIWPAQMVVPTRPAADFEAIAKTFCDSEIPIFFNSFAPCEGREYLYMNAPARAAYEDLQQRRTRRPHALPAAAAHLRNHLPEVCPSEIDARAVRDALWLTLYGFDGPRGGVDTRQRIDGAYARQFILNELCSADTLFMARPQAYDFKGNPPRSWFDVQDFDTEAWFNGAYAQQLHAIDFVNRLVLNGALRGSDYHIVELAPIEIEIRRGFFSYFLEDPNVFDRAFNQSRQAFHARTLCAPAPALLPDAADD